MKTNKVTSIILILLIGTVVSSCKQEGCTDPKAINYNVLANEDDGSCILCQTSDILYDSMQLQLVDKRTSSPYYNDTVGHFNILQFKQNPNDLYCGKEISYINLYLVNLINEDMLVDFDISRVTGPLNFLYGREVYVNAQSTHEFGLVQSINSPPFYKISLDSLKVTVNGIITYF